MSDFLKTMIEESQKSGRSIDALESMVKHQERMQKLFEPLAASLADIKMPTIEARPFHALEVPTQKQLNEYQSAAVLIRRLAGTITQWRSQAPAGVQPAILAILHGGIQINVTALAQESFHGVRIEGEIEGNPCMLLAHQSSVQLLCHFVKVEKEEFRRKIGFVIDGEEIQA